MITSAGGPGSAQVEKEAQDSTTLRTSTHAQWRERVQSRRTERDPDTFMSKKEFERKLKPLHVELVKLQLWAQHSGLRAMVIFEGRDAAGKGGAIKAITERVSPRVFRIDRVASAVRAQKTQMYMQRYMEHLPAAGEIILFDRSWYNRAGVEHVLGFCTDEEYHVVPARACPLFERAIVQNGIILIKYWFEVEPGATDRAVPGAHQRRAQDLEAERDGPGVAPPLVRLLPRARCDVRGHRYGFCAVVRHQFR